MVAAVLIACMLILAVWMRRRGRRKGLPPGPPALPVIGNLLQMKGEHPQRVFARLAERYGPIVHLRLGSRDAVVVSSAAMAREFLQVHDNIFASRPAPLEISQRVLYGQDSGLSLTRYGPRWRAMRRLCATHLFTPKKLLEFRPILEDEIRLLLEGIRRRFVDGGPLTLDLSRAIVALSENMIGRMLFSRRITEVVDPSSGISLHELTHRGAVLLQTPVVGDLIPWLGFLDWRVKRTMDELHASYDSVLERLLRDREAELAAPAEVRPPRPVDFLDELVYNCDSRNQIKTMLAELIGGGVDTAGVAIEWAMTELLSNPKVLQQLQDELDSVVGRKRLVKETDLGENTPYLQGVIKETLRLHPPAPLLLPHCSTESCHIASYVVPRETRVFVNVWAIARDPKTWDSPEKFRPERFLVNSLNNEGLKQVDVRGRDFELIPFGSGRRICPGMSIGMASIELILASLIHCFDWSISPLHGLDKVEKSGTVLARAHPLILIPSPRILF